MIPLHPSWPNPALYEIGTAQSALLDAVGRLADVVQRPAGLLLTNSCSAAIEAAATVLDLRPGDEVVVPAYTFPTTATPFLARGATLRFADARPDTGNIYVDDVESKLGPRTRAVVCMHYAGIGADVGRLVELGEQWGFDLVEDAAHGVFASIDGVPLGRSGRFGCLSFHRTKNVSTIEGGALLVNRPLDVARATIAVDKGTDRAEFDSGRKEFYEWAGPGSALRMSEPAVQLLAPAIVHAEEVQPRRMDVWSRLADELRPWAAQVGASLPVVPAGRRHPAHLFYVLVPDGADRDAFVDRCRELGVGAARHFGSLPQSAYGRTLVRPGDECPVASDFAARVVRLPVHGQMTDTDVDRVLEVVTGVAV